GDAVDSARKGDAQGTTDGVGKTAGDTVDGVRKTVRGATGGGSSGSGDSGGSSGSGSAGDGQSTGGSSADSGTHGSGASGSTDTGGKNRNKARASHAAGPAAAGAAETSLAVHLQQWAGQRRSLASLGSRSSTTRFADRQVRRPEVAPPPAETSDRKDREDQQEPIDLGAARPAADTSAPGRQQPPPATVVLAS
ncbi:MAG: hypothetical protein GEU92_21190, partial [Alphaproteobacteria bacterium]|nr:hypothetical protein [Alphaproteobacteria bacterium]